MQEEYIDGIENNLLSYDYTRIEDIQEKTSYHLNKLFEYFGEEQ